MGSENMFVEFLDDIAIPQCSVLIHQDDLKLKDIKSIPEKTLKKNLKPKAEENNRKNVKLKHYRGKCAEIFIENGECYITCEFCEINFTNLELFLCHIYKRHLIMKNPYSDELSLQEEKLISGHEKTREQIESKHGIDQKFKPNNQNIKKESNYILDESDETINQNTIEVVGFDDQMNYTHDKCRRNSEKISVMKVEVPNTRLNSVSVEDDGNDIQYNSVQLSAKSQSKRIQSFEIPTTFSNHEHNINFDSSYCCDICNEIISNEKDYKLHYEKHLTEWKSYTCPICPKSFNSTFIQENAFNLHMKRHLQQQSQKDFQCQYCIDVFPKQIDLLHHIETNHRNLLAIDSDGEPSSNELFNNFC